MDAEQLSKLLPELDQSDVHRATRLPRVQAAMKDLKLALVELSLCEAGTKSRRDWETTKDELLMEIKRLTKNARQGL